MTGSKAKVKKALQLEVDRLEELKMQNMKKVIEAIRVELAQYWDQCFIARSRDKPLLLTILRTTQKMCFSSMMPRLCS